MTEKRKLEFFLLRYVPDAIKGEFVNFGLLALEDGPMGSEVVGVRFTKDWARVVCLDPQADLELLAALERELKKEIGLSRDRASLLRKMEDSFSNLIQISQAMPALTERTALAEIDEVARTFLEAPKLKRSRETSGRQRILATMRDEFEKAGVLTLMSAVPVEPYTKAGDPFEFDYGYKTGKEMKLFHAVSMRASVDTAVLLAARYPRIAPAMAELTGNAPLLTAVVEAELDRNRSEIGFALEMMRESMITVSLTTELPTIAERARTELRA